MTLLSDMQKSGQLPRFSVEISSLGPAFGLAGFASTLLPQLAATEIDTFLSYSFDSGILIPVDAFSFSCAMPDRKVPLRDIIREGDLAILKANGTQLSKGIIDTIVVATDQTGGETITVSGRDMMGQLEDQDAVNAFNAPIYANDVTLDYAIRQIIANTRISASDIIYRNLPQVASKPQLLASEVGEKKMQTLQRLLEGLNCLAWTNSQGKIVIGQPTMIPLQGEPATNVIICSKTKRYSNVTNIQATRSAAQIPNSILPIWVSQGLSQSTISSEQIIYNNAPGPDRLRRLGHLVPQTVTVSHPKARDAVGLSGVQTLINTNDLLTYYAKREIARRNVEELQVQCTVPGHYNEITALPYTTDTIYYVDYEAHDVSEMMYLHHVQYYMDSKEGAFTRLFFTRLGTIIADALAIPGL